VRGIGFKANGATPPAPLQQASCALRDLRVPPKAPPATGSDARPVSLAVGPDDPSGITET